MIHGGFLHNDMQRSRATVCERKQCTSPSYAELDAKQKNDRLGGTECNDNTREEKPVFQTVRSHLFVSA